MSQRGIGDKLNLKSSSFYYLALGAVAPALFSSLPLHFEDGVLDACLVE